MGQLREFLYDMQTEGPAYLGATPLFSPYEMTDILDDQGFEGITPYI
ncbi:hypothetical protein [Acidiferrobacter sp.]|nr:hypothetical protein [Acidiferrobacter sp.]